MKFRIRAIASFHPTLSLTLAVACLGLAGCGTAPVPLATAKMLKVTGAVHGGQQPVTGATIQLYAAGSGGDGTAATPLIAVTVTTSDGSGNAADGNGNAGNGFNTLPAGFFTITGQYTCPPNAQVYLVGMGGNPGLNAGTNNQAMTLMAALGPCSALSSSTNVFVNELTTVGSIAALAPYMSGYTSVASGAGDPSQMSNAFATVSEYVNTSTGTVPGPTLPASSYASSYEIDTLGDAIAPCVNSNGSTAAGSPCAQLFAAATPPNSTAPSDTVGAVLDIVKNPANNVCPIYGLVSASPPFLPTLSACPANWSLPISAVTVSVSGAGSVYVGSTAQYMATVTGASNQAVTWSVNGVAGGNANVGTISASGLYAAPTTNSAQTVTISATSILSSTAAGSTSVAVQPVTVTVSGPATVIFGQTGQYSAVVTGNSSQSVTWTVNGVAGGAAAQGTITSAGVYTAPASAPSTPVTIGATSTAGSGASNSVGVTIAPTAVSYATGDTRTVIQPSYPGICATLTAQFSTSQRTAPPVAASDDTARIQAALNSPACKNTGLALELASSGGNNAFFSEEITLNGEGLTVDSGTTLYGGATYSSQSYLVYILGANSSLNGPGTVDGRGDLITGSSTRLVEAKPSSNLSVYNVTLAQSIYPNLYIQGGNGITVWGVTVLTPATRSNADGIDLDSVTNATVTNSIINAGDDGVAVKTNSSNASNITVTNNKLYGTHGLSIGSIPNYVVSNVLFLNNYVYGNDQFGNASPSANGLVIKIDPTCAATVQQVTYQNTCMTQVKHLITFYTNYSNTCSGAAGTPVFTDIIVNGLRATNSVSGAYSQFNGWSAAAPSSANLAYISLDANGTGGSLPTQYTTLALDQSSITPIGTGITTTSWSTPGSVPSCTF